MEGETINEDCIDSWICCDRCGKWRRVPKEMADGLEDDAEWYARCTCVKRMIEARDSSTIACRYCEFNPNPLFASCNVPQELTNEEIDQEEAGEVCVYQSSTHVCLGWIGSCMAMPGGP
jgi:hypothetical protein